MYWLVRLGIIENRMDYECCCALWSRFITDQELSSLGIKGLIAAIKNKGGKPGLARSSKPKLIEKLKSLFKK